MSEQVSKISQVQSAALAAFELAACTRMTDPVDQRIARRACEAAVLASGFPETLSEGVKDDLTLALRRFGDSLATRFIANPANTPEEREQAAMCVAVARRVAHAINLLAEISNDEFYVLASRIHHEHDASVVLGI